MMEPQSAQELLIERTTIDGFALACIAYGILSILFVQCVCYLAPGVSRTAKKSNAASGLRHARLLLLYASSIFALATIAIGGAIRNVEMTYVDYRDDPGAPKRFIMQVMSWISIAVLIWLADGILLYRFFIIYGCSYWFALFPGILYLATIGISAALINIMLHSTPYWSPTAIRIGTISWTLSVFLNVTLTLLIIGKLIHARRIFRSSYPAATDSVPYLSISAMMAESAMLYSIIGLFFVASYGARYYAMQSIFNPLLGQVAGIATLLIIVRVAQRRACCQDGNALPATASAIAFSSELSFRPSDVPT